MLLSLFLTFFAIQGGQAAGAPSPALLSEWTTNSVASDRNMDGLVTVLDFVFDVVPVELTGFEVE